MRDSAGHNAYCAISSASLIAHTKATIAVKLPTRVRIIVDSAEVILRLVGYRTSSAVPSANNFELSTRSAGHPGEHV